MIFYSSFFVLTNVRSGLIERRAHLAPAGSVTNKLIVCTDMECECGQMVRTYGE